MAVAQFLLLGPFFYQGQLVTSPLLYHYLPGSTQEKIAWEDRDQNITAQNPIEGDANGLVMGYFSGLYKLEVRTQDGVLLVQKDGVQIVDPLSEITPSELRPEDYDGEAADDVDNFNPIMAAIADLPTTGGTLRFGPGNYKFSGTIDYVSRNLVIQGAGRSSTFLTMTTAQNFAHGIIGTGSLTLRDLTLRTQSNLALNYQMAGVRVDLEGTGLSGGVRVNIEHCDVVDWNIPLYCDGGAAYGIALAKYHDVTLRTSGPAADYVGSCGYMNRVRNGYIGHSNINQNNVGEHALYCFGSKMLVFDTLEIQNATRTESQAIKCIGNSVSATNEYAVWNAKNINIKTCTNGIDFQIYGTEILDLAKIENVTITDIDGTLNIPSAIFIEAAGTSRIRNAVVDTVNLRDLGYAGVQFNAAAGATFEQGSIRNLRARNWSMISPGTYSLFLTNGNGTYGPIDLDVITADGNSNGRTIVGEAGQASTVGRVRWRSLTEVGTTTPGRPIHFVDADPTRTTPSCKLGNHFYVNNTVATVITRLEDVVKGEEYILEFANSNTTLTNSARLQLAGAVNFVSSSNDMMRLLCTDDTAGATVMKELSRSVN